MVKPDSIVSEFEKIVALSPNACAMRWDGGSWTYAQLNARANRMAHFLIKEGVQPEDPVGVFSLRSPEVLAALLGILKAGGAYVPLDPNYPEDRIKYYLEDSAIKLVLFDPTKASKLPPTTAKSFPVDVNLATDQPETNPECNVGPKSLAHILYTSGSTGRPKGVQLEHGGVLNLTRNIDYMEIGPGETFLKYATLSFDASTFETWAAWLNGACLAVPQAGMTSLHDLGEAIRNLKVTCMLPTASLMALLVDQELDSLAEVRQIITGGDVVSPIHAERFLKKYPGSRIINAYGPTESTVIASVHPIRLENPMPKRLSIGRPIKNTDILILDDKLQPVSKGEIGELVITGANLARGYVNQPEATKRSFVEVTDSSGRRIRGYRTGDLGRYNPDGTLDFRGRIDDQVKINGIRIEPGEIKIILESHPEVMGTEVIVDEILGQKHLEIFAILKPDAKADEHALRDFLREKVPGNWLPGLVHIVPHLPLNINGKVDRAALLASLPSHLAGKSNSDGEPRDYLEKAIWGIWRDVLPGLRITRNDHFTDLGGSSLTALDMISRVEKMVGHPIGLRPLLEGGTIVDIAAAARATGPVAPPPLLIATQSGGAKPPFFFAHGDYICGGLYCQRIAQRLEEDQPLYALAPQGTFGGDLPASFEDAGADYVKMIRSIQPHGPYYLGGFCNGAVAMYEVAQQLIREGEAVASLVLLDPPDLYFFILRRRIHNLGRLLGVPEGKCRAIYQRIAEGVEIWQYYGFMQLLHDFWKRVTYWVIKHLKPLLQLEKAEPVSTSPNLNFHYYELMAAYLPKTYLGEKPVWVILRQGESDRCPRQMSYWSGFIPNVHFEVIPGTHLELQSSMRQIAAIIQLALDGHKSGHLEIADNPEFADNELITPGKST